MTEGLCYSLGSNEIFLIDTDKLMSITMDRLPFQQN